MATGRIDTKTRDNILEAHVDSPNDPICIGCARLPNEIPVYVDYAAALTHAEGDLCTPASYVYFEEGTFNPVNGHFLCDECYIEWGMPTSPSGWKAP